MTISKLLVAGALAGFGGPQLSQALDLQPETLKAWDAYIRDAELRMHNRLAAGQAFLWMDESNTRSLRVRGGEVVVEPVAGNGTHNVPDGLIHDWIGAVFIPHGSIASLLVILHDYARYSEIYKPAVFESRSIACSETGQEFSMVWRRRVLFVNAAIEGRYRARDVSVNERRGYSIAASSEVREIEGYGHAGQRLLPADTGNGFLWRMHSIARYEERDGGLYLEVEAFALTRQIPASLRWMVNPVVNRLSIDSLCATLRQTRDAVNALPAARETLAMRQAHRSCAN
jgi:hypothetical protein